MGQYYTPVIIRKTGKVERFSCYDYDNGAKLMEHSYMGNTFVETVVKQLLNKEGRLAWVGDYAKPEDVESERAEKFIKEQLVENYSKPEPVDRMENSFFLIFVNHSKKEYFHMQDYVLANGEQKWGGIIHPLPLLTAIGNGKGGGDYRGTCLDLVGHWACDRIEVARYSEGIIDYKNITEQLKFKED